MHFPSVSFYFFLVHVKHHNNIYGLFQTKETQCDPKQSVDGYRSQPLVRFGQSFPFLAVLRDILALIRRDHTLTRPTQAFSDALTSYPTCIHGRCRRSYLFVRYINFCKSFLNGLGSQPKHLILSQVNGYLCLLSCNHGYAIQKIVLVLVRALCEVGL